MTHFQVISPVADGSVYAERAWATGSEIESVLVKSKIAQKHWKQTSINHRADICRKMVAYMVANATKLIEITWQMGRPIIYTPSEIRRGFQDRAEYMIGIAEQSLANIEVKKIADFQRFIQREPVGTVLVLTAPWNYPFLTSVNVIVPAIMAGNSVVLKHSDQTPLCAERYAQAFEYAGLPQGVFQYLHANHDNVSTIVRDQRIDYVAFTGSVAGGEAVQRAAHSRFVATGLELGGKDPAYVRADADLGNAIENLVDGAMFNSGQSCCGIERIYVHENLYDDFVDSFVKLTQTYILGNPFETTTNLGPMVRTAAADFVRSQTAEAVSQGAKALIAESSFANNKINSPYLLPQVLVNVNHQMRIMNQETFGPVVGIIKVKDDAEAIALMNDSVYGLTASVWTTDQPAALHIGNQIDTGTFFMNRCDYLDPELAWTGIKNSGRGCTLSALGYEAFTRPKSFHLRVG